MIRVFLISEILSQHEKKEVMENFYSHKLFRALNKSLRFQCDSVKCDQNDKSFFNLIKILTALKNKSYGKNLQSQKISSS